MTMTFWMLMKYGCGKCGLVAPFYLETGCEGPTDGVPLMFQLPADHPVKPLELTEWPRTGTGRLVVPVPFMAMGCPICQPKTPWSMAQNSGVLTHEDWQSDEQLSVSVPVTEDQLPSLDVAGRFYYPPGSIGPSPTAMSQQPCGIPAFRSHDSRKT